MSRGATTDDVVTYDLDLTEALVPIRPTGTRRPFFVVHGAGGNVICLREFGPYLRDDLPVYAFHATGINGIDAPDDSIEAMAERYVDALAKVRDTGPYLLGGYSAGGTVALEMARRLGGRDGGVERVVLFDTVLRESELPPRLGRYRNALVNGRRDGFRAILPWARYTLSFRSGTADHDVTNLGLGFGDVSSLGLVDLTPRFLEALDRYHYTPVDVDVLLVRAQKVFPVWPWHYGWEGRINGRIDVITCPGDHFEMFDSDHAPALAELLNPYL